MPWSDIDLIIDSSSKSEEANLDYLSKIESRMKVARQ